jgi:hypothetical protein
MSSRPTEIDRCYGMEMNVQETKVMRISSDPFPLENTIDEKQLEKVPYFNYLGSMVTNDGSCASEYESMTALAKAAFNKKMTLFTSKLN